MKAVVYSPAALARFADILGYTIEPFGAAQADAYAVRLAGRLKALASGHGPESPALRTPCAGRAGSLRVDLLSRRISLPDSAREAEALEVVEIFHERMNIEEHLERLLREDTAPL